MYDWNGQENPPDMSQTHYSSRLFSKGDDNSMKPIIAFITVIVTAALCIWLTKIIAESDLPLWLKFVILKG